MPTAIRVIDAPEADHPLYPLFVQYDTLRELAVAADRECEQIAATPSGFDEPHPVDVLAGQQRDYYLRAWQKRDDYTHAANMLRTTIDTVTDNLGGL